MDTILATSALLLQQKSLMTELIQQHLSRAQERMRVQANKTRSERQFLKGDWVYLKLQPYVQSSLAQRANQKLAFKFFGPFQVLEKIGVVAYKLKLPDTTAIHSVFHLSQLKTAVPADHPIATLPHTLDGLHFPQGTLAARGQFRGLSGAAGVHPMVRVATLTGDMGGSRRAEAALSARPCWTSRHFSGGGCQQQRRRRAAAEPKGCH